MDEDLDSQRDGRRRQRLLQQLDRMVDSGRVTDRQAQLLRLAETPREFDDTVRDIRVGHTSTRLNSAVADGTLPQEEAGGLLERLRNGEHSRTLQARLRRLPAEGCSRAREPRSTEHQDTSEEDSWGN
jgi:hypothetical protein